VPITSLTKDDFAMATAFLANKLDRRGVPWTYGQSKAVNDFNDQVGWAQEMLKIFTPILDGLSFGLVSRVGGAISEGAGGASVNDAEHVTDAYQASIAAVPQWTATGENSLVVKEAPAAGEYDASDPLLTQYGEANKAYDSTFIDPRGPSLDFGYEPIEYDWGNLYFRCQLFATSNEANSWRFPWVCRELGYPSDGKDGGSITDKTAKASIIAKRARLFRALDVLGGMLKPDYQTMIYGATPDADGNINITDVKTIRNVRPGLFAYKVGAVELWGCVLPAAPEDKATDLRNTVGKQLARSNYVGEIPAPPLGYKADGYTAPTAGTVATLEPAPLAASIQVSAPIAGAPAPTATTSTAVISKSTRLVSQR
jgi:hypothetical protein